MRVAGYLKQTMKGRIKNKMAKKIRKKHVSIYCQYCQCSHGAEDLDVDIEGKEVKIYCQESGLEIWANKEDKQKLIEIYNN